MSYLAKLSPFWRANGIACLFCCVCSFLVVNEGLASNRLSLRSGSFCREAACLLQATIQRVASGPTGLLWWSDPEDFCHWPGVKKQTATCKPSEWRLPRAISSAEHFSWQPAPSAGHWPECHPGDWPQSTTITAYCHAGFLTRPGNCPIVIWFLCWRLWPFSPDTG